MPPRSGYFYPNKFARIYLDALQQVTGDDFAQLAETAGLPQVARMQLPDNLEKSFDFTHVTNFRRALTTLYGAEAGNQKAYQAGEIAFEGGLRNFGDTSGLYLLAQDHSLPLVEKLQVAIPAMAEVVNRFSDQLSRVYQWDDTHTIYTLERCPMCWHAELTDSAQCQIGQGFLVESLRWLSDGLTFPVEIAQCIAEGAEMGKYVIYHEPLTD